MSRQTLAQPGITTKNTALFAAPQKEMNRLPVQFRPGFRWLDDDAPCVADPSPSAAGNGAVVTSDTTNVSAGRALAHPGLPPK